MRAGLRGLVLILSMAIAVTPAGAAPAPPGKGHKLPPGSTSYEAPPKPIFSGAEIFLTPPEPKSYIDTVASLAVVDRAGDFVQSATCGAGQQMLGGGFYTTAGNYVHYLSVKANYPSADDTWTVTFHSSSGPEAASPGGGVPAYNGVVVAAYAYCFHASGYPLGLITVTAASPTPTASGGPGAFGVAMTAQVDCPAGSVLTGGGYSVDGASYDETDGNSNVDLTSSMPTIGSDHVAHGWQVFAHPLNAQSARTTHAYARCATKGLTAVQAAELAQDLTQLPTAVGLRDFQVTCPDGAITTAGGVGLVGDDLVPHPWYISRAGADYRTWSTEMFGGWQTPNYSFRPCQPGGATSCLTGVSAASCYQQPDVPYINIRIISPPGGYAFPTGSRYPDQTDQIVFTANVYDRNNALIPDAVVSWTLHTPIAPNTPLGTGNPIVARLPAGQSISDISVSATATVSIRQGRLRQILSATDTIKLTTGTVP